ncbi:exodeoxyribonuclease I subunit C [Sphaerotilus hippei]|uniref:Exodeoxyribonuclease I n=1 Tax=Sphaerotilus hippei TaxID=744406 RepID=A0A318GVE9_9BURK|nr:exodeoxyribonuclease I [Sphaerotilus hippei]PXW92421.1 exodeoxyribonuclease I subunit C [Sphaerotilus hippei]
MSATTFFWHDYETFGRVPRRDRPAQFAGIRTDAELNEIGEPVMFYCRPAPDYLPDPESCLLTGILPQTCLERGVSEREFADRIEAELARPDTVGVGYNTLRFDDEVTRHLFWRNLIEPYAREWQNGCGRWDLVDMVRCAHALRPEGIEWPRHEDGRPSFRLEDLTRANGLGHDAAHDALSDVRATLALARLLRERQPRLFDFCLKLRRKDAVIAEIGIGRPFLHVSGMYGADRGGLALVWPLAPHPTNKNELIVWDLAHDPAELMQLNATQVRERLFSRSEDLPEGVSRLPIKSIHLNKCPIVISNLKTLTPARAVHWGLDVEQGLRHAEAAARMTPVLAGLWPEVYARAREGAPIDVDEDLYGGFVGQDDRRTLQRLKALEPVALAERLQARAPAFDDPRLEELVFRFRARNHPEMLDEAERQRWLAHCTTRLHEGLDGYLTLTSFFERIDALGEAGGDDERTQDLLGALYDYAEQIAPEVD